MDKIVNAIGIAINCVLIVMCVFTGAISLPYVAAKIFSGEVSIWQASDGILFYCIIAPIVIYGCITDIKQIRERRNK